MIEIYIASSLEIYFDLVKKHLQSRLFTSRVDFVQVQQIAIQDTRNKTERRGERRYRLSLRSLNHCIETDRGTQARSGFQILVNFKLNFRKKVAIIIFRIYSFSQSFVPVVIRSRSYCVRYWVLELDLGSEIGKGCNRFFSGILSRSRVYMASITRIL